MINNSNTNYNINYNLEFKKLVSSLDHKPKLLLHVCCAPCATYCLTRVLPYFDVTLYYSNNNITDFDEWQRRLDYVFALANLVNSGGYNFFEDKYLIEKADPYKTNVILQSVPSPKTNNVIDFCPLKVEVSPFSSEKYYFLVQGLENEKEGGARCTECFKMRLCDSFDFAFLNGFDFVGTTLTVSPYKNSKLLNEIGLQLQQTYKEKILSTNTQSTQTNYPLWLPSDFKKENGYNKSIQICSKLNIYRQHFCGCEFSKTV